VGVTIVDFPFVLIGPKEPPTAVDQVDGIDSYPSKIKEVLI
jgi:hypothetical protein